MRCIAEPTLLERARDVGFRFGRTLIFDSEEEAALVMDMAVHTAKPGRSRAIDRYAKGASMQAGSDEALMLDAMIGSWFSIWDVKRPHEEAGLIITDVLAETETETWLVDEGLELSASHRMLFAARLYLPGDFAMTSGVIVPIDPEVLEGAFAHLAGFTPDAPIGHLANDLRFAAAIYRVAIQCGVMETVRFQDCSIAA